MAYVASVLPSASNLVSSIFPARLYLCCTMFSCKNFSDIDTTPTSSGTLQDAVDGCRRCSSASQSDHSDRCGSTGQGAGSVCRVQHFGHARMQMTQTLTVSEAPSSQYREAPCSSVALCDPKKQRSKCLIYAEVTIKVRNWFLPQFMDLKKKQKTTYKFISCCNGSSISQQHAGCRPAPVIAGHVQRRQPATVL